VILEGDGYSQEISAGEVCSQFWKNLIDFQNLSSKVKLPLFCKISAERQSKSRYIEGSWDGKEAEKE